MVCIAVATITSGFWAGWIVDALLHCAPNGNQSYRACRGHGQADGSGGEVHRIFAESPDKLQPVTCEITMLGRQGLDMNDPTPKYTLKTLPGNFSGLHLVSYLYVGMKNLAPDADPGIDLAREYEQAQALLRERTG